MEINLTYIAITYNYTDYFNQLNHFQYNNQSLRFNKITKDTQLPQMFGHMPFIKWKLQENDINYVMSILLV